MIIIPSFFIDKASCTRQFESELSLHSLASLFPIKDGSTFLTKPLFFPQGREDVTAIRCSEPLRYKVGGASKPSPWLCGMGPPGDSMLIGTAWLMFGFQHKHINSIVVLLLFYNFEVFLMYATDGYSSPTEVEDELAVTVYADNVAFIVFEWS